MIKVYVDASLDMPLGKICAQVSHAVMKLALDRFRVFENKLIIDEQASLEWFLQWRNSGFYFELSYLDDLKNNHKELNNEGSYSFINDQGRTCFNGETTLTTIAYTEASLIDYKREIQNVDSEYTDNESRQILCLDRTCNLSDKDSLIKAIAKASMLNLFSYLKKSEFCYYFELDENEALRDWLIGSFAKITLSVKGQSKFSNLENKLIEMNIAYAKTLVKNETENNSCLLYTSPSPRD